MKHHSFLSTDAVVHSFSASLGYRLVHNHFGAKSGNIPQQDTKLYVSCVFSVDCSDFYHTERNFTLETSVKESSVKYSCNNPIRLMTSFRYAWLHYARLKFKISFRALPIFRPLAKCTKPWFSKSNDIIKPAYSPAVMRTRMKSNDIIKPAYSPAVMRTQMKSNDIIEPAYSPAVMRTVNIRKKYYSLIDCLTYRRNVRHQLHFSSAQVQTAVDFFLSAELYERHYL